MIYATVWVNKEVFASLQESFRDAGLAALAHEHEIWLDHTGHAVIKPAGALPETTLKPAVEDVTPAEDLGRTQTWDVTAALDSYRTLGSADGTTD